MKNVVRKLILLPIALLHSCIILHASSLTTHKKAPHSSTNKNPSKPFTCYNELPQKLQYLIADYAGLNSPQGNSGWSLLQTSIQECDFSKVATLINCGALVNGMTPEHQTAPLYLAVRKISDLYNDDYYENHDEEIKKLIKIVQFLIVKNADINQKSPAESHETALHKAINITDSSTTLHLLIRAGANLNIKNRFGQTPLDEVLYQAVIHYNVPNKKQQYQSYSKILKGAGAQKSRELESVSTHKK